MTCCRRRRKLREHHLAADSTAAQHAAEYGVTYDTSRTMFMRALARAMGAALRGVRGP